MCKQYRWGVGTVPRFLSLFVIFDRPRATSPSRLKGTVGGQGICGSGHILSLILMGLIVKWLENEAFYFASCLDVEGL